MVEKNKNLENIFSRVRLNNQGIQLNVNRAVEQVLNRFGFNVDYANQPYFASPFLDYVQQAKLPRDWKP